jgi:hypothetical protein
MYSAAMGCFIDYGCINISPENGKGHLVEEVAGFYEILGAIAQN